MEFEVVTQDEAEINHMMESTIIDTIINSLNRIYCTGSHFELIAFSVEEPEHLKRFKIGKTDSKDNNQEVKYVKETIDTKNKPPKFSDTIKDQEKYNTYCGSSIGDDKT